MLKFRVGFRQEFNKVLYLVGIFKVFFYSQGDFKVYSFCVDLYFICLFFE